MEKSSYSASIDRADVVKEREIWVDEIEGGYEEDGREQGCLIERRGFLFCAVVDCCLLDVLPTQKLQPLTKPLTY